MRTMTARTAREVRRRLMRRRPRDRRELRNWLRFVLDVRTPARAVCAGHCSPMDYLEHAFFERPGDPVVWANRGGGKTFYGAVATLLDLLFKPGIEVRVLGGSLDQSQKMYGYLRTLLDRPGLRERVDGKVTQRGVRLHNGSAVELLAQSEKSVRGSRVQKLRCDEVELFDREVWDAAQFVTRSARCGGIDVRGALEVFSTMHRPHGLMSELVGGDARQDAKRVGRRVFGWCVMDVLARCEPDRPCDGCELWTECGGRAKAWDGFLSIDDALAQKRRASATRWEAEMLCARPSVSSAVYPGFDPAVHVRELDADRALAWVGGIDFGIRDPMVVLWAQLRPIGDERVRVEVMDEQLVEDETTQRNARAIARRGWPSVAWFGVDPAGGARQSATGTTDIAAVRAAGYAVRTRPSRIVEGIELVRRRLTPAAGDPTLVIHPRCRKLIDALTRYHFDPDDARSRTPVKDGPDHAADALRYLVVNLDAGRGAVKRGRY